MIKVLVVDDALADRALVSGLIAKRIGAQHLQRRTGCDFLAEQLIAIGYPYTPDRIADRQTRDRKQRKADRRHRYR